MRNFPIGIIADSLRLPLYESLEKCAALGADGVHLYAVAGEMAPERFTAGDVAKLRDALAANKLSLSAICGDLGGHGFTIEADNPGRIERSKRIMALARQLDCAIVTTHIGVIPEDKASREYDVLLRACAALARTGSELEGCFAIETGPEPARRLLEFLQDVNAAGLAVNLDPANLVMVTGEDPVEAVHLLKDHIVHTHAKDGVMVKQTDPARIYNYFAEGGIGDLRLSDYFEEVPLGQGQVDFPRYLRALEEIGYTGFLTIERETGANPEADIALAVDFLRRC
ncbi:sugar phosphate isomerase/epimerase [Ruminococcaceae bacterium OttesenSCG-928-D13]|nr:sugar phosphate isomerase/epimerase [Ruminococcaceae bacterium OttesenSCG-928-D13]